ncbi:hypothetical protein [Microcystis viridis]|uniref:hypothetical protein n=1 Tax=Microcystis viridis TaxID=44822 RepID=UPI001E452F10|nr:hypothetical protein [Microcystis viridis]
MCDNQCLLFGRVLLGKALKNIFLENYPYSSPFHTETRRANILYNSSAACLSGDDITQIQLCQVAGFVKTFFLLPAIPNSECSKEYRIQNAFAL